MGQGACLHAGRPRCQEPVSAFVDTIIHVRHLTGDPPDIAARATADLGTEELCSPT